MNLIISYTEHFKKKIKKLAKKYNLLANDLKLLKLKLEKNPECGVKLKYNCFKLRISNSSSNDGKSGGFRVIYYFINDGYIFLLEMYSKSEMSSLDTHKLLEILKNSDLKS